MSADEDIINRGEDNHASIHDDVPVHGNGRHHRTFGPEREEPDDEEKAQGNAVDVDAVSSQAPSSGRESVAAEPLGDQASKGDLIRGRQSRNCQSGDSIERYRGADVDERE